MSEDLSGRRFDRYTVLYLANPRNDKRKRWVCKCDCGNIREVRQDQLVTGRRGSHSCGCARIDATSTHRMTNTRLYRIWNKMKDRCYNPNHVHYKDYGGRGISVCAEWKNDFFAFYLWASHNGYASNLTLDRIDGNKGYYPENCRWASALVQQNNTKWNRFLELDGIRLTIGQWARELKMPYSTIYSRLCNGWNAEKALTVPIDTSKSSRSDKIV